MKTLYLALFCGIVSLSAQTPDIRQQLQVADSGAIQTLSLVDGSTLTGRITEVTDAEIVFEANIGTIHIPIHKIKKVETVRKENIVNGEVWFRNPNATRLFFAPTAQMLDVGEAYIQDVYLFFVGGQIGITKNISVGGGTIIPGTSEF